ncbi:MAG: hypothetical protein PF637_14165 [Spirochaetes bacterium]|nr:hypothetical protein [Spirochaetota bacterium]
MNIDRGLIFTGILDAGALVKELGKDDWRAFIRRSELEDRSSFEETVEMIKDFIEQVRSD